jgi:hypothetical protein
MAPLTRLGENGSMNDFVHGLGVGAPIAAVLCLIGLVVKHAIKTIIEHTGKIEIEAIRKAGAIELEKLKTELTLPAEVRRQAAAKKVKTLLRLAEVGAPLMRYTFDAITPEQQQNVYREAQQYFDKVRNHAYLFGDETRDALLTYWQEVEGMQTRHQAGETILMRDATEAARKFHNLIRSELGLDEGRQPPSQPRAQLWRAESER